MAKNTYDDNSIKSLKGADRVRLRPSVIFGSDGLEGCEHAFFEILSNSIDEFKEGYGKKIIVTVFNDGSIEVKDFGRGVPVDWNEKEKAYNWELLFCEMYAGGKYDNETSGSYEYSLGLNGLGLCATQYASEYMEAEIYNGEYSYNLQFKKGKPVKKNKEEQLGKQESTHASGSRIKWRPDRDVFTDINIPREYFSETIKKQAVCNAGLTIILKYQTEKGQFEDETYLYENGIEGYLEECVGVEAMTSIQNFAADRKGRDREDKPEYKVRLNVVFCFTNTKQMLEYYHNSSFLEYGGSPDKAVKSAFVHAIDAYLKQNNKYLKNESKITFADIADCLALISNSQSTVTSYENQTKKAINNKFIQECMTDFLKHSLEVYFIENKQDADKIADQVLINKRSREQAEKTRVRIKETLTKNVDLANRVQKFVDCRTRDVSRREIYIVEGDSALSSVKLSRDAEYQGVMPVRGKILNCLKADYARIFKSEIITDLIKVLGCGVEVEKHGKELNSFSLENLRWSKVIICTDADVDGYQIRTLILTMLWRLTPTLLREGYVYIAESPLYEIQAKGKTWFAYTEREKAEILSEIGTAKAAVNRSKGLGENDPEMMWLTTMNPETRRLIKVMPEDAERTAAMFDLLLGDDLAGRKNHIAENGSRFLDLADLS